jgi:Tfp pilus assembly protein PilO
MELNRHIAKLTAQEMIEKLQDENKYLRKELIEEKVKSGGNISALNKELTEIKEDNSKLSRQIDDYLELKEHQLKLRKEGII